MNTLRRVIKLVLLTVLGLQLAGCVIVPLHGWGHGYDYGHGGYEHRR